MCMGDVQFVFPQDQPVICDVYYYAPLDIKFDSIPSYWTTAVPISLYTDSSQCCVCMCVCVC